MYSKKVIILVSKASGSKKFFKDFLKDGILLKIHIISDCVCVCVYELG